MLGLVLCSVIHKEETFRKLAQKVINGTEFLTTTFIVSMVEGKQKSNELIGGFNMTYR